MYTTGMGIFSLIVSVLALIITIIIASYLLIKINKLKTQLTEHLLEHDASLLADEHRAISSPPENVSSPNETPKKRGPNPSVMADARIEWMEQITLYTEEMLTHSATLLQASKKIIQSNREIKSNVATRDTHQSITENASLYTTSSDEFKIVLAKLRLTFYDERKNAEALKSLKKIERIIKSEYESQIHSDISRHDFLVSEYEKQIAQFVSITRKQLEDEWDKIKRGL